MSSIRRVSGAGETSTNSPSAGIRATAPSPGFQPIIYGRRPKSPESPMAALSLDRGFRTLAASPSSKPPKPPPPSIDTDLEKLLAIYEEANRELRKIRRERRRIQAKRPTHSLSKPLGSSVVHHSTALHEVDGEFVISVESEAKNRKRPNLETLTSVDSKLQVKSSQHSPVHRCLRCRGFGHLEFECTTPSDYVIEDEELPDFWAFPAIHGGELTPVADRVAHDCGVLTIVTPPLVENEIGDEKFKFSALLPTSGEKPVAIDRSIPFEEVNKLSGHFPLFPSIPLHKDAPVPTPIVDTFARSGTFSSNSLGLEFLGPASICPSTSSLKEDLFEVKCKNFMGFVLCEVAIDHVDDSVSLVLSEFEIECVLWNGVELRLLLYDVCKTRICELILWSSCLVSLTLLVRNRVGKSVCVFEVCNSAYDWPDALCSLNCELSYVHHAWNYWRLSETVLANIFGSMCVKDRCCYGWINVFCSLVIEVSSVRIEFEIGKLNFKLILGANSVLGGCKARIVNLNSIGVILKSQLHKLNTVKCKFIELSCVRSEFAIEGLKVNLADSLKGLLCCELNFCPEYRSELMLPTGHCLKLIIPIRLALCNSACESLTLRDSSLSDCKGCIGAQTCPGLLYDETWGITVKLGVLELRDDGLATFPTNEDLLLTAHKPYKWLGMSFPAVIRLWRVPWPSFPTEHATLNNERPGIIYALESEWTGAYTCENCDFDKVRFISSLCETEPGGNIYSRVCFEPSIFDDMCIREDKFGFRLLLYDDDLVIVVGDPCLELLIAPVQSRDISFDFYSLFFMTDRRSGRPCSSLPFRRVVGFRYRLTTTSLFPTPDCRRTFTCGSGSSVNVFTFRVPWYEENWAESVVCETFLNFAESPELIETWRSKSSTLMLGYFMLNQVRARCLLCRIGNEQILGTFNVEFVGLRVLLCDWMGFRLLPYDRSCENEFPKQCGLYTINKSVELFASDKSYKPQPSRVSNCKPTIKFMFAWAGGFGLLSRDQHRCFECHLIDIELRLLLYDLSCELGFSIQSSLVYIDCVVLMNITDIAKLVGKQGQLDVSLENVKLGHLAYANSGFTCVIGMSLSHQVLFTWLVHAILGGCVNQSYSSRLLVVNLNYVDDKLNFTGCSGRHKCWKFRKRRHCICLCFNHGMKSLIVNPPVIWKWVMLWLVWALCMAVLIKIPIKSFLTIENSPKSGRMMAKHPGQLSVKVNAGQRLVNGGSTPESWREKLR